MHESGDFITPCKDSKTSISLPDLKHKDDSSWWRNQAWPTECTERGSPEQEGFTSSVAGRRFFAACKRCIGDSGANRPSSNTCWQIVIPIGGCMTSESETVRKHGQNSFNRSGVTRSNFGPTPDCSALFSLRVVSCSRPSLTRQTSLVHIVNASPNYLHISWIYKANAISYC